VAGVRAGSVAEFRDAFAAAMERTGPTLIDIDMTKLEPMGGLGGGQRR
jgi:hypothetical protein